MKSRRALLALLLAILGACGVLPATPNHAPPVGEGVQEEVPTEVLNPDVRQETINLTICVPGYAASVRPSATYTNGVKLKLMREQAISVEAAGDFELDHRIPLALGGHPRNLKNLMLQPWEGEGGARAKDRLERRLQRLVCTGGLLLEEARRAIYVDWQEAYRRYVMTP